MAITVQLRDDANGNARSLDYLAGQLLVKDATNTTTELTLGPQIIILGRGPLTATTTSSTADTPVATVTIPAGALGQPVDLRIVRFAIYGAFLNTSGANRTFTPRLKLGGQTMWGDAVTVATGAFSAGFVLAGHLKLDGTTNTVRFGAHAILGGTTAGASVAGEGDLNSDEIEGAAGPGGTATVDTTAAQDLVFTTQINNTTATSFRLDSYLVELI